MVLRQETNETEALVRCAELGMEQGQPSGVAWTGHQPMKVKNAAADGPNMETICSLARCLKYMIPFCVPFC